MPLRCLLCLLYLITEKIDAVLPLCRSASLLLRFCFALCLPASASLSAAASAALCCRFLLLLLHCLPLFLLRSLPACLLRSCCLPALCIRFAFALLRSCCLLLLSLCCSAAPACFCYKLLTNRKKSIN